MLKRILSQKLLANTSSHNYFLIRGAYSLTSIGSGDGEQSHEARVVMLKPVTQQLPRLSRSPPIYPDVLISLYMCEYVTMFGHYFYRTKCKTQVSQMHTIWHKCKPNTEL